METTEIVFDILSKSEKPLKSAEIATLTGIDKKEIDKAIKALKTTGKIESPKNCYYSAKND